MRSFLTAAAVVCVFAPSARAEPPVLTGNPPPAMAKAPPEGGMATAASTAAPMTAKVVAKADEAAPAASVPVKVAPPPSLVARINLSTQRMDVRVDGHSAYSWPISSGRSGYLTPTGRFGIQRMHKMWYSRKYDDAPMPHAIFFNGGIAVHGTSSIGMLGSPASHGCVRLAPNNAAQFYSLVNRHGKAATRIEVVGSTPARVYSERRKRDNRVSEERRPPRNRSTNGWGDAPIRMAPFAGAIYIDRNSPHYGRRSFVQNGVRYVRVR